ncbi:hypothetical protein ANN_21567 [Periplaneta americana]|uniref:PiggyBac transposable element-derived protein domain-containing protein n=1 Tax=Periplaneta americana TaxID=6978 RepID=A0ABQ8S6A2_PERAM|nr:hypothetical protein ANN_21567 [Periplaneta americana]
MNPGSSTESYPAFARIGLRENPGKNLNQVTYPDRDSNPGHLVSRPEALTVTPQGTVDELMSKLNSIYKHCDMQSSVEKEMAREEETSREAGAVRRQLFREEEIIRPIDSIESDVEEEDMVEEIDHNTDSAQSADEVDLVPGPIYTGKDGVTTWEMHCPPRNRRVGERLLYMAGVLRASHLNLFDLWSADGKGVPYFRTCMNRIRFKFLVTVLRFDDSNTRQERRSVDKLAPIRSLFEQIVQKCSENFTVSEYVTIDEMLESFRGSRSMENSIVFGFTKDKTLLSYCPKKKKVVLLLSTMHHTDEIDPDSEESRKPYMLTFYNSTKGGVDMVDEYKAREITGTAEERNPPPSGEDEGPGRCHLCDWKKNRKSKMRCNVCRHFICKEHTQSTCTFCANPEESADGDSDEDM